MKQNRLKQNKTAGTTLQMTSLLSCGGGGRVFCTKSCTICRESEFSNCKVFTNSSSFTEKFASNLHQTKMELKINVTCMPQSKRCLVFGWCLKQVVFLCWISQGLFVFILCLQTSDMFIYYNDLSEYKRCFPIRFFFLVE